MREGGGGKEEEGDRGREEKTEGSREEERGRERRERKVSLVAITINYDYGTKFSIYMYM